MNQYIHPTKQQAKDFFRQFQGKGKVSMLNLLKFRAEADYSQSPQLAPETPVSGNAAYERYMQAIGSEIKKSGAQVRFMGPCGDFVIGPLEESWDLMLVVEYPSVEAFMAFSQSDAYQQNAGHRTAALADSRLLPIG